MFSGLALLAAAMPAHAAPEVNIKSGLWRIAVVVDITPAVQAPASGPLEVDRCVSAADTRNLLMTPPGAACSIEQKKFTSDVLEWVATCSQGPYTSTAKGRLDFKGTKLEGRIVTETRGVDLRIDTRVAGRYLGACVSVKPPAAGGPQKGPAQAQPQPQKPLPGGLKRYEEQ